MSNYSALIEKFKNIANDHSIQDKITCERITERLDERFPGLVTKILEGTNLSIVERIKEIKTNKEFSLMTDDEKQRILQFSDECLSFNQDDRKRMYLDCITLKLDFAKEIHEEFENFETEDFKGNRHFLKKWQQFCRLCIVEYDRVKFMDGRIWDIYDAHWKHYQNAYFKFKDYELGERDVEFPRNFPRVELLEKKSKEFYLIHKMILNNVSFKSKKRGTSNTKPRGSINWKKTIEMQIRGRGTNFVSHQNMKDFVTPENKLLIIVSYWMMQKANEMLENENMTFQEKEILSVMKLKMKNIIVNFPFTAVPQSVKLENLTEEYDQKISKLISETTRRISTGKIRNGAYKRLLKWIDEVRNNAGLKTLRGSTMKDSLVLLSLRDIDTLYEIWILFELIHRIFMAKNARFKRDDDGMIKKILIDWEGKEVELVYDELVEPPDSAPPARPDYLFKSEGKNVAVFDAKNYNDNPEYKIEQSGVKADASLKVMGYMTDFECTLGLVLLPHKKWGNETQKITRFGREMEFGLHLLVPDKEHNDDDDKNPKKIREIVSMLDRVISNPE